MSTAELKNKVIKKIVNIQEDYILEDLLNLIELETNKEEVVTLTNEEKQHIQIGLTQVANGETVENAEVEQEFQRWLDNE